MAYKFIQGGLHMNHTGTVRIDTPRLILRRFDMADVQPMFDNWASDPEVTRYLTWPPHANLDVTEAVLRDWTASYAHNDFYQWAIVLKENGPEPIGSIAVVSLNETVEGTHIGYCLGRRWWHQGIMSEALQAVIGHLFNAVHAQRIDSMHDPRNPHSGGVMKKCGMQYEGTLRRAACNNQGIADACYYSILAGEYHL